MKNLGLTSLLCGGVLSLTAASALAQQSSTTQPGSSPSSPSPQSSSQYGAGSQIQSSTSPGSLGSSSSALDARRSSMHTGNSVRLSQLMHSSVQSQEGKSLGQVRDLIVDPQSGRIDFAILSLSSAAGATDTSTSGRETVPSSRSSVSGTPSAAVGSTVTGKLIPVPWQLFSQSFGKSAMGSSTAMGAHNLTLNIDESKLRSAPSFDAMDWNQLQSGALDQRVYSYFGVDRSSATGTAGSSISGQGASGSTLPQGSTISPQGSSSTPDSSSQPQPEPQPQPQESTSPQR
jgi:sporulation protein YlmC with PRC-barrel domain